MNQLNFAYRWADGYNVWSIYTVYYTAFAALRDTVYGQLKQCVVTSLSVHRDMLMDTIFDQCIQHCCLSCDETMQGHCVWSAGMLYCYIA